MRDEDDPVAEKAKTILFWVAAIIVGGFFFLAVDVGFPQVPKIVLGLLTVAVVIFVATIISKTYHDG